MLHLAFRKNNQAGVSIPYCLKDIIHVIRNKIEHHVDSEVANKR